MLKEVAANALISLISPVDTSVLIYGREAICEEKQDFILSLIE
jgi:hypothetical protein